MKKISGNAPLSDSDPELYSLIKQEKNRQRSCLELIASENFTSKAVMDAVSHLKINDALITCFVLELLKKNYIN